jgi:hypothetical protein
LFAQDVGMAGVPAGLLDHVYQDRPTASTVPDSVAPLGPPLL